MSAGREITVPEMLLAFLALLGGVLMLIWSADRFVGGAAGVARALGLSPLLIGMVVVGFGTSAPELLVSLQAALQGSPGIALGNAWGSNIANIALILGVTALVHPLQVRSRILRWEIPLLLGATVLSGLLLADGSLGRGDSLFMLVIFLGVMGLSTWAGRRQAGQGDALEEDFRRDLAEKPGDLKRSWFWVLVGLMFLMAAARLLIWGAVRLSRSFGVGDLVIGLTVVALGTSLPELASSLAAVRKGEHDLALGNVLGSNLFNTLAVVGLAGSICPMQTPPELFVRDLPVMGGLTLGLWVLGRKGTIRQAAGTVLTLVWVAYTLFLVLSARGFL